MSPQTPSRESVEISLEIIAKFMLSSGYDNVRIRVRHYLNFGNDGKNPINIYFSDNDSVFDFVVEFDVPIWDTEKVTTPLDKEIFLNNFFVDQLKSVGVNLYNAI